jgi:hypothetical protein
MPSRVLLSGLANGKALMAPSAALAPDRLLRGLAVLHGRMLNLLLLDLLLD